MFFFTNNQIEPPSSPDNLLHTVLVSDGDGKPDDEDGDVVQLVAQVQVDSFPKIPIHHSKQIEGAYWFLFFELFWII